MRFAEDEKITFHSAISASPYAFNYNERLIMQNNEQTPKILYFLPSDPMDIICSVPVEALSPRKRSLLQQSVHTPSFYITFIDYGVHPTFVSYRLELAIMSADGSNVNIKHVQTRYSQLHRLYHSLLADPLFKHNLPPFPGKLWFNNLTRETAERRMKDMSPFVESLNKYIEIRLNPIFSELFHL